MNDPKPTMRTVDTRGEIMAQMAVASDDFHRSILILMLGQYDDYKAMQVETNRKLDALLSDGDWVQDKALNGHKANHHTHHDFVGELLEFKSTRKKIDAWALEKIEADKDQSVVCEWARRKMVEDMEAEENAKSLKQQFLEAMVSQAGVVLAGGLAALAGLGYLFK